MLTAVPGRSFAVNGSSSDRQIAEQSAGIAKPIAEPTPGNQDSYHLDSGDRLKIRFYDRFDRDDLNGEYEIGENGQLRLPRLGVFEVRNKSTEELEHDIRLAIESRGEKLGYFSIDIAQCRPFYVSGLANRPGSYPFVRGLTVLHAVSLAGGLYRSPTASVVDSMREKRTLAEALDRLAELIARQARLQTERNGAEKIPVPKELAQLEPLRARELTDSEAILLQRSREVESRERSALESTLALTKREAESYRTEIARTDQRIADQTLVFNQLRKLHEDKVINQQRFFESVTALDASYRDRQSAVAGFARANTSVEKTEHDLEMLTLAKSALVAKALAETEHEITRLKMIASETRHLISRLDLLAGQSAAGQVFVFRIMRRDRSGALAFQQASETTPIMPGDVIEIENQTDAGPAWLN